VSTTGIVSVSTRSGFLMKITATCNGMKAPAVADAIMGAAQTLNRTPTPDEVYEIARQTDFGCKECLVVMDAEEEVYHGSDIPGPKYREHFARAKYHPAGWRGESEHTAEVALHSQP